MREKGRGEERGDEDLKREDLRASCFPLSVVVVLLRQREEREEKSEKPLTSTPFGECQGGLSPKTLRICRPTPKCFTQTSVSGQSTTRRPLPQRFQI